MKSRYLSRAIAQRYFGSREPWLLPETWVGLFTTLPSGPDDGGAELDAAGYARQPVINDDTGWLLFETGGWRRTNAATLYFGPAHALWPAIGFGIWDAAVNGHLLHYGPLDAPLTVYAGQGVCLPPQAIALVAGSSGLGGRQALEYAVGGMWFAPPGRWWVEALIALNVDETRMDQVRPSDLDYATARPYNQTADWPVVADEVSNAAPIVFPPATVDWPNIVGLSFHDVATKSLWWVAPLTATVTVRKGERLEIPAGGIAFRDL